MLPVLEGSVVSNESFRSLLDHRDKSFRVDLASVSNDIKAIYESLNNTLTRILSNHNLLLIMK